MKNITQLDEKNEGHSTHESIQNIKPDKTLYCEVQILENIPGNNIGIGIASKNSAVVYHGAVGELLTSDQRIPTGKSFGQRDIIGCQVTLDVYKSGDHIFNHCQFFLNGQKCADPIILEGSHPFSVVSLEATTSGKAMNDGVVEVNVGHRPFKFEIGN